MEMTYHDRETLRDAKGLVENVSFAAKIANAIGRPVEMGIKFLPGRVSDVLGSATRATLHRTLEFAVKSLDAHRRPSADLLHKIAVAATGAGGGAFGLAGLPIELPLSTTIMLRSIADVARSQGEPIQTAEAKLACMEVFALGARPESDDAVDVGYFAVRAALAKSLSEAAQYLTQRGFVYSGAPALVRFIAQVASRFGVTISEKLAAQAIPILGAAGAAIVNVAFMDHYQNLARGHFTIRRLERTYSPQLVKEAFEGQAGF